MSDNRGFADNTGKEKKLGGLKLAYCGDGNNNITHSLIEGCTKVGIDISVACPRGKEVEPHDAVLGIGKRTQCGTNANSLLRMTQEKQLKAQILFTQTVG